MYWFAVLIYSSFRGLGETEREEIKRESSFKSSGLRHLGPVDYYGCLHRVDDFRHLIYPMHVYMYIVYCYNNVLFDSMTISWWLWYGQNLTILLVKRESTTLTPTRTRVIHPPLEFTSSTYKPTRVKDMTPFVSEFVALVLVREDHSSRHGV